MRRHTEIYLEKSEQYVPGILDGRIDETTIESFIAALIETPRQKNRHSLTPRFHVSRSIKFHDNAYTS